MKGKWWGGGFGVPYHQAVTTGLQSAETNAEQNGGGERVVVDEATTLSVAVLAVQGQVCSCVTRVEHGTEIDLKGDGLDPTVNADVPLRWRARWETDRDGSQQCASNS